LKNAVVVFTKVPKVGEVKTRLTEEKGGILTPEEAKEFYQASLLDILDSCIEADCCDIYICQNKGGDMDYLKKIVATLSKPEAIKEIFVDEGKTFDQGMQYAADYILKNGSMDRLADSVIILGGDIPIFQPATLREAVKKIEMLAFSAEGLECARRANGLESQIGAGLVESIDQEGGFNLIGYTYATPFDFDGVFYNRYGFTALDMIVQKVTEKNIPVSIVEMIPDVDLPGDLASLIPAMNTLRLAAKYDSSIKLPRRTDEFLLDLGIITSAPVPDEFK
jgi:glycosyltransferase A (GT-A) superfamily protein (DUF2064 family)